jgi:DNA helicase IV
MLRWERPARGPASAPWTLADAVLVDELADIIERQPSLGHVVLDEAQDLSPMQLRAVGRRCSTGAATILGDIAQGTTPWATADWEQTLLHLGKPNARIEVLRRGYRVPALVIELASRLLPHMAVGVAAAESVRDNPGLLEFVAASDGLSAAATAAAGALAREGSVGLIVADRSTPDVSEALSAAGVGHDVLGAVDGSSRLTVVPASLAKGLEYDHVVVLEPADIVDAEPSEKVGLRRLYVVLTRAVSGLTVVHTRPVPPQLSEEGGA